jgi:hypothetical protein
MLAIRRLRLSADARDRSEAYEPLTRAIANENGWVFDDAAKESVREQSEREGG